MNNPVHTTSDGRQLQTNFYTPYFMDALTGRNKDNYSPINKPISQGMANVGNFFGRYNLYLDMAKPPSENQQSWIDAANRRVYGADDDISTSPSKEFKSNMPILNPATIDGGLKMWQWYSDPVYKEINDSIIEANNTTQRQPSRLDYINRESYMFAPRDVKNWMNQQPYRQREIEM